MKDAKGHGSNKRGMARVSVTRPVGYTVHGVGPGGKKTLLKSGTFSPEDAAKTSYSPNADGRLNGPLVSNAAAAAALASGPKSAPAPVHDAMKESHDRDAEWVRQRGGKAIPTNRGSNETPRVVADTSVKGATHALVKSDGTVVGRLYKKGSPAWR